MPRPSSSPLLSVSEAQARVRQHAVAGPSEPVSLAAGLHRIVAGDLNATADSPPFDKALMDGFAVSSTAVVADSRTVRLRIAETVTAGRVPQAAVDAVTAVRIMTGSPLPRDCDCVVPIEETEFDEARPESVTIPCEAIVPERSLIRRGTSARIGEPLIHAGTCLAPQQIAALAEFGITQIPVVRRPAVAMMATGDELVDPDQLPAAGQIRNSNEPMLAAMTAESGARPCPLGIARDTEASLRSAIERGLQSDLLLLSGGVSAGTHDLVPQQLAAAGVTEVFHGVNLKPGKPLWFGTFDRAGHRCLVFGLPGNPVSSLVCFRLFVSEAIRCWLGRGEEPRLSATLTADHTVRGRRPVWHPARLRIRGGTITADIIPWSGSSDLRATVEANGMCLLDPEHGPWAAGTDVPALAWNLSPAAVCEITGD